MYNLDTIHTLGRFRYNFASNSEEEKHLIRDAKRLAKKKQQPKEICFYLDLT